MVFFAGIFVNANMDSSSSQTEQDDASVKKVNDTVASDAEVAEFVKADDKSVNNIDGS